MVLWGRLALEDLKVSLVRWGRWGQWGQPEVLEPLGCAGFLATQVLKVRKYTKKWAIIILVCDQLVCDHSFDGVQFSLVCFG